MTRRKSRKPSGSAVDKLPSPEWDYEDEIALIAWPQNCLARNIDFKATAVEQLQNRYTWQHIDNKLRSVWTICGSDDSKHRTDIYKQGIACLGRLLDEEREAILKAVELLQVHSVDEDTLSTRTISACPRLRSTSNTTGSDSRRIPSHAPNEQATSEPCTRQEPEKALRRDGPKDRKDAPKNGGGQQANKRLARRATRSARPNKSKRPNPLHGLQKKVNSDISIPDSEDGIASIENDEASTSKLPLTSICEGQRILPRFNSNSDHPQKREKELITDLHQRIEEQDQKIEDQNREIDRLLTEYSTSALHKKIRELDNHCSSLSSELEILKSDIEDREDCWRTAQREQSKVSILYERERANNLLKQRLTESRRLARFTRSNTCFIGFPESNTRAAMEDLEYHVKLISHLCDNLSPFISIGIEENAEIRPMLYRILGLNLPSPSSITDLSTKFLGIGPQNVLRAITTAALCVWIFESDFPNFNKERSHVLQKYREHLASQDGLLTLRNLDLAAHQSLIEDTHFQTFVIPTTARDLAIQLSQTLAPFHPSSAVDPLSDGFRTWGQAREEYEERRELMCALFEQALRLKAELLISTERYEMVTALPGAMFNVMSMRAETMEGINTNPPPNGTYRVKSCLFPAVYSYCEDQAVNGGEDLTNNIDVSRVTVQYRNFTQRPDGERRAARLITKAVVILEDEKKFNGTAYGGR